VTDRGSVFAGLAVVALGVLLLLDQAGTLEMSFGYAVPAVLATAGAALVAFGLSRR